MILPTNPFPFSRFLLPRVREPQMCTTPLLKHLQTLGPVALPFLRLFPLGNRLTENQCQSVCFFVRRTYAAPAQGGQWFSTRLYSDWCSMATAPAALEGTRP